MPTPINGADTAWMLISTALVLLMTPALGFFYGGLVRGKNALNTMMMSVSALGFVGLAWALIFGVLASTVFSLLVVPVAYYALHLWRGGAGAPGVPPDSSSEASAST